MSKSDLSATYKDGFFRNRHILNWRSPIVCSSIISILKPKSVIDLGCGHGDLVAWFNNNGIDALGIEGSPNSLGRVEGDKSKVIIHDLREIILLPKLFDLTLCLEVAEHIEPEYEAILISNLTKFSDKILFSAAPVGSGGINHFNCQSKEYWVSKITKMSFTRKVDIERRFLNLWYPHRARKGIKAFYENIMYFERS